MAVLAVSLRPIVLLRCDALVALVDMECLREGLFLLRWFRFPDGLYFLRYLLFLAISVLVLLDLVGLLLH